MKIVAAVPFRDKVLIFYEDGTVMEMAWNVYDEYQFRLVARINPPQ